MGLKGSTTEEKIWNFLKAKGLNDYGTAGLMGNLFAESGLIPTNLQNSYEKKLGMTDDLYTTSVDNGDYSNFANDSAGYGLAQWTYHTRKKAMLEYARSKDRSIGDPEIQLEFLVKELSDGYKALLNALKTASSVKAASDAVLTQFERPADQSTAVKKKRASYGEKYYKKYAEATSSPQNGGIIMARTVTTGFISDTVNGIKVNSTIKCSSGNYDNMSSRSVAYVVMHYTGNSKDAAKANANYFKTSGRNASAHFFVDDTAIYQSVELRDKAWHCGTSGTYYHNSCRNTNSIGIEMCCTAGNYKISDKTKKNAAYLCAHICKLLGITASGVDTYVLRHYDVTHKNCPAQMAGANNAEWTAFKSMVKSILSSTASSTKTTAAASSSSSKVNYRVKINTPVLNVRKGPGTNYGISTTVKSGEVYTIVAETNGWGKLKSGAGYISLSYTVKV